MSIYIYNSLKKRVEAAAQSHPPQKFEHDRRMPHFIKQIEA